ncbi:MAG: MFS transporter [Candidatus Lloydbacteria bacterium RIFCSPHIGHO2_01_FULL_49_22]|uniref:MFS transporter n=1 Tax=Candidatus Lloydbacteria bacterium RIFCSPHIGHO2_01_FULL_49_22 TaxID=1798658 RepID=A0A1G2CXI3_9BACT|nr:MAG: MFS transporter [Candidatus Lloydbacteria bacterium RIFCSPHIGHO2_01_FULL_49_22]OGZ09984.1 MAG: MFS transporter [Candidatus Lloydbacteria bacterium RIFCSPHIGHO2_02_FULL_50_18]
MKKGPLNVHPDVIKLGIVSFLTDLSSEAIFSVFSLFFTVVAGASTSLLGLIEGLADLSASSLNYFSGWLSDRYGKRKPLAVAGYGFSTVAKTILLFGTSVLALGSFRVIERLGKSFRGPPKDAWLAEMTDESTKGYVFGLHKAMDKAGAVLGPLVAYFLLRVLGESTGTFHVIFFLAVITAALSVVVLLFIKDRPGISHERENMFKAWGTLSPQFRSYLIPAGIFSLAYFSFGFLLLRAYSIGFSMGDVVLLYALFNVSFVIISIPIGKLGDIFGRKYIVALGYVTYIIMSLGFVFATEKWEVVILFLLFGIFYSIDDAQSKAFIMDIEKDRRATAIGVYNFVTGLIYLPASVIAGVLWVMNPAYAFIFAAIVTSIAMGVFIVLRPWNQNLSQQDITENY